MRKDFFLRAWLPPFSLSASMLLVVPAPAAASFINSGTFNQNAGTLAPGLSPFINLPTGLLRLFNNASAGIVVITNLGRVEFHDFSTGANVTINNSGSVRFFDTSTAGNAIITTLIGGTTFFQNNSTGGNAQLIVNAGGTLDFSGTSGPLGDNQIAAGSITSAGTLVLGQNQVLTVATNLAFQSGALYAVQVNPASASQVNVTGTATLAGNVQATFQAGSYAPRSYDIVHATGGLGGTTFDGLSGNVPSNFTENLSYTPTDAFLNLTAALGVGGGLIGNQQNVANAISSFFNTTGALPPAFAGLFNLTGNTLANALSQLSGEAATDAKKGVFQLGDEFLDLMLDPLVDGSGGYDRGQASGFAAEQETGFPPDIAQAYAGVLKTPPEPANLDRRWSAWGSGFGGSNTTRGEPAVGSNDVSARAFGYATGVDYHATPDMVLGFALAGGGTNWSLAQGLGGGRSDAFQAGLYGAMRSGPAYVAAVLAFAEHWISTDRVVLGDQVSAKFNAQNYSGRIEAGYRYGLRAVGVTPYAALQAQSFHIPGYNETDLAGGPFALSYNAATSTDTRSELGARFDFPTFLHDMPLVLRARAAWAHDWVTNPALDAVFQALPGASFIVNGAAPTKDSAVASAGAVLLITPNWSLAAKFDGEFAGRAQTYAGTGALRYPW